MIILLIGPQGSGKGTQGEFISRYLNIPLVTVGDLLRNMDPSNPRYNECKQLMADGKLAPYDLTANLLKERVAMPDCEAGYVLDGWGRIMDQFKYFDPDPDIVFNFLISRDTTLKRLSTRRTCSACGVVYNIVSQPPLQEGICDKCGGALIQREDDTEDAINQRLEIYERDTSEVVAYYEKMGKLIVINGESSPDEVFELVKPYL